MEEEDKKKVRGGSGLKWHDCQKRGHRKHEAKEEEKIHSHSMSNGAVRLIPIHSNIMQYIAYTMYIYNIGFHLLDEGIFP